MLSSLGAYYLYQQNGAKMSSKLIPSDPSQVMVIRDITPNVVTLSVPFARFGMIDVGGRATIGKGQRKKKHLRALVHASLKANTRHT